MNKIKLHSKVCYQNNPSIILTVIEVIKGEKTNKPVYHSGILFNGYERKPKKYKLSDNSITLPCKLKFIA